MLKIIKNKIQCNHCKDIIESKHRHSFVTCSCGKVSVDGGKDYLKRSFYQITDFTDLSETIEPKNDVLIVGNGFLANRISEVLNYPIVDNRIMIHRDIDGILKRYKPKILINCIGFVGKGNTDDCENNIGKTLFSNSFVPIILAEACIRNNVKLVHISSGCIYNYDYENDLPVPEDQDPDFFDLFYSRSKIYSERALELLTEKKNILILRIRIPLDNTLHSHNILTKLLTFTKLNNAPNSITYIPDFIKALEYLIEKDAKGLFNVVNNGEMKYEDLMKVYCYIAKKEFNYEIVTPKDLNLIRTNIIMSTNKLEEIGFKMRNIEDIYLECCREYIINDKII